MNDDETDESNAKGKEGADDNKKHDENSESDKGLTALDRAEAANKEKAINLDREEKLLARKEKLVAIQQVGGQTVAGGEKEPEKEETNTEYRDRIDKEISEGKHND